MADILAPTTVVNTAQTQNSNDWLARQIAERALIEILEAQSNANDSTPDGRGRGFEFR